MTNEELARRASGNTDLARIPAVDERMAYYFQHPDIPQVYPDGDNIPRYDSGDAYLYMDYTKDRDGYFIPSGRLLTGGNNVVNLAEPGHSYRLFKGPYVKEGNEKYNSRMQGLQDKYNYMMTMLERGMD